MRETDREKENESVKGLYLQRLNRYVDGALIRLSIKDEWET